jgi:two-component system OmpR family response regulator
MRILVIDNDRQTLELVSQFLRVNGHLVDTASKGHQGLKLAALGNYDILVVDRLLPGLDGLSIVQSLRSASIKSSVLFLTALGSIEDRIEGLDCGGDDYLIKPFALGELLARINALGRRPAQTQEDIILRIADLEVHLIRREVRRAGETISLQPREFKMLEILLRNRGRVTARRMLLEQVWGLEFDPKTTVVQTNVCRLRDKIDRPGRKPLIHTVRGVGYRMDDLN